MKGIYSPNEARKIEKLPPAPDGDIPRVQQQVVPLTAYDDQEQQTEPVDVEAALLSGMTKALNDAA
jgi:hypothetical protein